MSEDDKNDIERRKFPAIAIGITLLVIGLMLVLALAKYFGPPPTETTQLMSAVHLASLGDE